MQEDITISLLFIIISVNHHTSMAMTVWTKLG